MNFSIIIPTFNSEKHLNLCLDSLVRQDFPPTGFEVLVADDCSTDGTLSLAETYTNRPPTLRVIRRTQNGGPGAARNSGLDAAQGQWVLFLDSDDELAPTALSALHHFLETNPKDAVSAVGFNWSALGSNDTLNSSKRVGRRDGQFLENREQLIHQYLTHRMDGSAIYTAVRKELLDTYKLRFAPGFHEDVDFIFKVYFHSPATAYFPEMLYLKRHRSTSIINTISAKHIDGYFRAWEEIGTFLKSAGLDTELLAQYWADYRYGTTGAIATRVREVVRHNSNPDAMQPLFRLIHTHTQRLAQSGYFDERNTIKTVYGMITALFWRVMNDPATDESKKAGTIVGEIHKLAGKSWSCTDLHHSLFLRADEVRTCCKRFFVAGEMRGDVILFDVPKNPEGIISKEAVLTAKRDLHQKINSGQPNACDGCPFLEFREWSPLNELDVHYLSMEHHTICNLRCTYCSDDYFGGKKTAYDIQKTLKTLVADGALNNCKLVVWGGGDPVLGKGFERMIQTLTAKIPGAQQRVLTNAVERSPAVEALLASNQAQLITSIDAGTEATFKAVRGRPGLKKVCENLEVYSHANSAKVTIKYIFTDGNSSVDEVRHFASLMKEHGLTVCSFQISCDFKHEAVDPDVADAMVLMFGLLRKAGSSSVYFDELLRHRLGDVAVDRVHALAGFDFIASPAHYPRVIIWGAGQQAKYLLEQSAFFKKAEIAFFVDATPEKIGTTFFGKEVRDPSVLRDHKLPVLIAAVQGYPLILEQYHKLGLPDSTLIQELIL